MNKKSFGSDNHSGIHPDILQALIAANHSHASAYGTEDESVTLEKTFQKIFDTDLRSYLMFNGTGCNVVGLKGLLTSYESVLCTDCSHIWEDECAAPEVIGGFKLIPVPHINGKMDISRIPDFIQRRGDQHYAQVRAISITQPTEYGTVYSLEELKSIRKICDDHNLFLHIDGARLSLSLNFLNISLKQLWQITRADVISFGGTKNGLLLGEALLLFRPERFESYKFLRKQSMQLPSKTRFIAAQFQRYLQDNLYLDIARHGHEMALMLAQGLQDKGITPEFAVQSNAVFTCFARELIPRLRQHSFFYVWNEKTFLSRLMCSFDTTRTDISSFLELI